MRAYGTVDNLQIVFGCSEQKIEIAEWVELAEVRTVGSDDLVVVAAQDLCAAQGIFDGLA
jgi:hypothetical protein